MLNDVFFKTGGPMFIFLGGEWEISKGRITGGHMYDMAREHNGLLVYTEHRYYGKSKPLPWVIVKWEYESDIYMNILLFCI